MSYGILPMLTFNNKTVLLRETARGITCSITFPRDGGGGGSSSRSGLGGGGTPVLAGGYSILTWLGVPPERDLGPVEVLWDGDGIPPFP